MQNQLRLKNYKIDPSISDIIVPSTERINNVQSIIDPETIDYVYCSPTSRTIQTARLIFPEREFIMKEGLLEMDMGTLSGARLSIRTYLKILYFYLTNTTKYQSEEISDFKSRCIDTFNSIIDHAKQQSAHRIAIIGHNGPIVAIMKNYLKKLKWHQFKTPYFEPLVLTIDD